MPVLKAILVRKVNLDWMLKSEGKFLGITQILNLSMNQSIFISEFVLRLVDQFWDYNKQKLLKEQFLPFVVTLILTFSCMSFNLGMVDEQNQIDYELREDKIFQRIIFSAFTLVPLLIYVYHEFVQANADKSLRFSKKVVKHFSSFWNWNDFVWLTFGPTVIFCSIPTEFWIESEKLVTVGSFVTLSMMIKAFDWMRLFDQTAFYIQLIGETI